MEGISSPLGPELGPFVFPPVAGPGTHTVEGGAPASRDSPLQVTINFAGGGGGHIPILQGRKPSLQETGRGGGKPRVSSVPSCDCDPAGRWFSRVTSPPPPRCPGLPDSRKLSKAANAGGSLGFPFSHCFRVRLGPWWQKGPEIPLWIQEKRGRIRGSFPRFPTP